MGCYGSDYDFNKRNSVLLVTDRVSDTGYARTNSQAKAS